MPRDEFFSEPSKHGHTFEDLVGQRFDKLVVVKLVGRRLYGNRKNGTALWECLCDCGNVKNITASALKNKKARSCSCYIRAYRSDNMRKKFPEDQSAKTQIFLSYEIGAKRRGLGFNLSKNDVIGLTQENCSYCNKKPSNIKKTRRGIFKYNGIDRVDNTIGYVVGNVVTCCKTCNKAKLEMSHIDFLKWIKKVYENNFGRKNV